MSSSRRPSRWSLQLATVFGIPIRLHATFFLLLVWWVVYSKQLGDTALVSLTYLLAVFACVVLHELGHALAARIFHVKTREIVLYPIGGVARLENVPQGMAEFVIAAAGPLVNLALGAALLPLVFTEMAGEGTGVPFLVRLCLTNFVLFAFNLLPAFPMDGGRILRALLSLMMSPLQATIIATFVGRGFALLLALAGLFLPSGMFLVLIAVFVFFGASQELAFQRRREIWRGHSVADAMARPAATLSPGDSLGAAARRLLDTRQQNFPVVDAWRRVAGVLTRSALLEGLAKLGDDAAVLDVMDREVRVAAPDTPLEAALELMRDRPQSPLVVIHEKTVVGLLSVQDLVAFYESPDRAAAAGAAPEYPS